jgi:phosphoglycolate phosphatase-like HAD superfamily hydrolase
LQLEVIEDEFYRLAALAGVLTAAMPLGHPNTDLDNAVGVARSAEEQIRMTLPYIFEDFDGKAPIEKEREAAVERYRQMYQRKLKDAVDPTPQPAVTIKKLKGRKDG